MSWEEEEDFEPVGSTVATPAVIPAVARDEDWEAQWEVPAPQKQPGDKPGEPRPKPPRKEKPPKKEPEKPKLLTVEEKGQAKKDAEERAKMSDFENTVDLFDGIDKTKKTISEDQTEILVQLEPKTVADFSKLAAAIAARTKKHEENPMYPNFVKELCKLLVATEHVSSSEVSDLAKALNIVVNDKLRVEKAPKKGMKKTAAKKKAATTTATAAAKTQGDEEEEEGEYGAVGEGDYDDFM